MTEHIINDDYTIDLDSIKEPSSCPYCDCNTFFGVQTIEIISPLDTDDPDVGDENYPNGVYENTCTKTSHKSVWMSGAQYKIVV